MTDELLEVERYELQEPPAYLFRANRRQFLGTLGAGFVIIAAQQPAGAQGQGQAGSSPLEARLHFGEDGIITVLTGKIEEGQGPRTELAMAAAEELRVPVDRIRMVMADTNLVPNDGTTAGSRSTPSTVPLVRRAAAAGRELLIGTAAEQWQVPRDRIQVNAGSAVGTDPNRKLTYADLARSAALAKAYKEPLPAFT
jgi:CO/xanthine dehydrogenase Mo-binding subunit